jgi:hypothetical protein
MPRASSKARSAPGRFAVLLASPLGRGLKRAGLCALAVLAVSMVLSQARAAVRRMPAYRIGPEDVVFDVGPEADDAMREGLRARLPDVWPAASPATYTPGVEGRLRQVLGTHPMVREVSDLEVRFPREVRARVTVRTPLALVHGRVAREDGRIEEGYVAVDGDAVVLDAAVYQGFLAAHDVVRVDGVRARCPPVGRRWIDADQQVEEALAVARVANRLNVERDSVRAPRVVGADVSGFPARPRDRARGEVLLLLEDGRRVSWGRTERAASSVSREDGYEAKRDRMADLLAEGRPGDLDVRFAVPGAPARRR